MARHRSLTEKLVVRTPFQACVTGFAVAVLLLFLSSEAGAQTISLETAARRIQARNVMLRGMMDANDPARPSIVVWPDNAAGQSAGEFPEEGFYGQGDPNDIPAAQAAAAVTIRDAFLAIDELFLNEASSATFATGIIESLDAISPANHQLSTSETNVTVILTTVATWLPKMRYRATELDDGMGSAGGSSSIIQDARWEIWESEAHYAGPPGESCEAATGKAKETAFAAYGLAEVVPASQAVNCFFARSYAAPCFMTGFPVQHPEVDAELYKRVLLGEVSTQNLSGPLGLWMKGEVGAINFCFPDDEEFNPAGLATDFPVDGNYHLIQTIPPGKAVTQIRTGRGETNGGFLSFEPDPNLGDATGWLASVHWILLGDMFQFRDLTDLDGTFTLTDIATAELLGEASDAGLIDNQLINPRDCNPVSLATGIKTERATDLTVQVTGPDFELFREYTSDVTILASDGGNLVGRGWVMNVSRRLAVDGTGDDAVLMLDGPPVHQHLVFTELDPVDLNDEEVYWTTGGPTTQRIEKAVVEIDDDVWPVWRLIEPGGWEIDFVREYESGNPVDSGVTISLSATQELEGLLLHERDVYDNFKTFQYYTAPDVSSPRLRAIYLNGSPKNPAVEAIVILDWYLADDQVPHFGLLDRVRVERWDAVNEDFVITHEVDYTYASESPASPDDWSADIGEVEAPTEGTWYADLVQVVQRVRVDKVEDVAPSGNVFWASVCQYRYHDDPTGEPTPSDTDDRLNTNGQIHQLKMVLLPEQIEYYAQKLNAANTPASDTVEMAAAALLELDDGAVAVGTTKVVDLAAKILAYYPAADPNEGRVSAQYIQTDCGCGGVGDVTQGKKFEYTYYTYSNAPAPEKLTTRVRELLFDGDTGTGDDYTIEHRRIYHDMERIGGANGTVPYLRNRAVVEPVITDQNHPAYPGGRTWVTHYEYDPTTRNLIKEYTPEAMASYTPADAATTTGDFSYSFNSTGLVHAYAYTADNRRSEVRLGQDNPSNPLDVDDFILIEHTTYGDLNELTRPVTERPWLPKVVERYQTEYTGPAPATSMNDDIEQTEFEYGFHSDSNTSGNLAFVRTIMEAELEPENGPGGVYDSYELFDVRGRNVWSRAPDLSVTYREFDAKTGTVTRLVRNADPNAPAGAMGSLKLNAGMYFHGFEFEEPTDEDYTTQLMSVAGWGRATDGGQLATVYKRDLLGRVIEEILPGAVSSYTVRELRTIEERPGIYYYAEVTLPHRFGGLSSTSSQLNGPARIAWMNAGADPIGVSEYTVDVGTMLSPIAYDPIPAEDFDYTLTASNGEIAKSRTQHLLSGVVSSTKDWYAANVSGAYHSTSFDYDLLGRIEHVTNANGTITGYVYDVLDRVISKRVGTTTGNLVEVARYFYDHDTGPVQGMGNGNLTFTRAFTGDNTTQGLAAAERDTIHFFDFRDRLVYTRNPLSPHPAVLYDNLDRPIATAVYSTDRSLDVGFDPNTFDPTSVNQNRGRLTTTAYSQRGLQFTTKTAINPALASPTYLESHSWFDARGREVASWGPNGPGVKRTYDAHSRVVTTSVTDRGGDARPGTTGNHADALALDCDIVLEQTHHTYNDEDRLVVSENRQRLHDATGTGALDNTTAIVTFVGHFYDDARRVVATVDYGTNVSSDTTLRSGGTAPDVTGAPPTQGSNAERLVTSFSYDKRGLVSHVTDPEGRITATVYDDLARTTQVVEDAGETDRTVSFTYNGLGQVILQETTVYEGDSTVQQTAYVYEASDNTGSLVHSNDLLTAIHYPNEETGELSEDPTDTVYLTYNAQGELRTRLDENGTRHDYRRDTLGRVTRDDADISTTTWPIDGRIQAIETTYDSLGRIASVESIGLDDQMQNEIVRNSVSFTYTPLWQVAAVTQDVDGDGDLPGFSSSLSLDPATLEYEYLNAPIDTSDTTLGNYSRLSAMTHTDGNTLCAYSFGAVNSLNERISRVAQLGPSDELGECAYEYIGLGHVAVVDYVDIDVQLDGTFKHNGRRNWDVHNDPEVQGIYHGWDRFGRRVRQAWVDGELTYHAASSTFPDRPPLFEQRISYDRVSNRLDNIDDRPGETFLEDTDLEFTYDRLNRLTMALGDNVQQWTLDLLGNWLTYDHERENIEQERLHNMANEIVEVSESTTLAYAYDDVGNLREQDLGATRAKLFTYDAWNRLVKVVVDPDTGTPSNEQTRAEYQYNGLGWRTLKLVDTDPVPNGVLDQVRVMYYDADWRLCDEIIYDDLVTTPVPEPRVAQQVWGLRHIDDAVARRVGTMVAGGDPFVFWENSWYYLTDAQFSAVALVDAAGDVVERVSYDPYGTGYQRRPGDVAREQFYDVQYQAAVFDGTAAGTIVTDPAYMADYDTPRTGVLASGSGESEYQHFEYWVINSGEADYIPDGWISEVDGAPVASDLPPENPIGFGGYVFNPETGLYTVRNRTYDPALGRWLQRDPKGYVDGMSMYQYVGSSPFVGLDPMGLERSLKSIVADNARFQAAVMAEVRAGRLDPAAAGRLINNAGEAAAMRIGVREGEIERRNARISAGGKAVVNSAGRTVMSFGTLGQYEADLLDVTAVEREVGYDTSALIARGSTELALGVATGGWSRASTVGKGVMLLDLGGNAAMFGEGASSAMQCGLTLENGIQMVGGGFGVSGNAVGAFAKSGKVVNTSDDVLADILRSVDAPSNSVARGAAHTADQEALLSLVDEVTHRGRKPLSKEDAETILDWAAEIGHPGVRASARDLASPSNWKGNPVPHIHLPGAGRGGHVPVQSGVRPRTGGGS